MQNIILTLGLLLCGIYLSAQYDPASYEGISNSTNRSTVNRSDSWEQSLAAQRTIERDISILIEEYKHLSFEEQEIIRQRATVLLYELLDLKIWGKEREVAQLDQELHRMQQSDVYLERQAEIHELQESLLIVKKNLNYRKRHRTKIVQKRLEQLLSGAK